LYGTGSLRQADTSVLFYAYPNEYLYFLFYNTTSFFASLCVVLLVISGFPLNSKFFIWFFTLAMTTSVASLTLAYLTAVLLVTPDHLFDKVRSTAQRLRNTWIGLVVIAGMINIIGLLSWTVKKLHNVIRRSTIKECC
jgi:hypothetical protein